MPSKKKKYNARFPAGRIKKIMQTDEDVGKVAQAVPVIISRTLELFVESLLKSAMQITSAKNAKTLTPSHMKQCILSESRFDFLRDLVRGIPDVSSVEDEPMTPIGNISPGMTQTFDKSAGAFSCFQFRRKSDGGSSRTPGSSSQHFTVPQTSPPKFYKELVIGGDDIKDEEDVVQPVSYRTPVIHHTRSTFNNVPPVPQSNNNSLNATSELRNKSPPREAGHVVENKCAKYIEVKEKSNCSSDDDEADDADNDNDDEPQENGYHKLEIVTKTYSIDEDYDT